MQNGTKFNWTNKRIEAAELVAKDDLPDEKIAAQVGVTRNTIVRWKTHDEFMDKVQEFVDSWAEDVMQTGIADRRNRIMALNDRWRRMKAVIEARAESFADSDIPGASTGLLIRDMKGVGVGAKNQVVTEYIVDVGLLAEMRAHEKQAAQELGQWTDRSNIDIGIESEIEALAKEHGMTKDEVRLMIANVGKGE